MQPLKELTNGLKILEPFLRHHGFKIDNYENGKSSGGQFTVATYKNGRKKFIIGYRYSVGELGYQFDNIKVGHIFYLDQLGFADKKQFPDFQSDDKLLAFRHILHDLDFLIDDFFAGPCVKLIQAAGFQDNFIKEQNAKAQAEYNNQSDKLKIEQARKKFKEKNYLETLEIYSTIEHKFLLTEFDNKLIEYCKRPG